MLSRPPERLDAAAVEWLEGRLDEADNGVVDGALNVVDHPDWPTGEVDHDDGEARTDQTDDAAERDDQRGVGCDGRGPHLGRFDHGDDADAQHGQHLDAVAGRRAARGIERGDLVVGDALEFGTDSVGHVRGELSAVASDLDGEYAGDVVGGCGHAQTGVGFLPRARDDRVDHLVAGRELGVGLCRLAGGPQGAGVGVQRPDQELGLRLKDLGARLRVQGPENETGDEAHNKDNPVANRDPDECFQLHLSPTARPLFPLESTECSSARPP